MAAEFIDIKISNYANEDEVFTGKLRKFNSQKKRDITVAIDKEPEEFCDQCLNFQVY